MESPAPTAKDASKFKKFSIPETKLDPLGNTLQKNKLKNWLQVTNIAPNDVTSNDVYMGRGPKPKQHSGNKYMRNLVKLHFVGYKNTHGNYKVDVVDEVMNSIRNKGGRFVVANNEDGNLCDVGNMKAYIKIAQLFRDVTKAMVSERSERAL